MYNNNRTESIHLLLLCSKPSQTLLLKIMHIYYFTVSVGQGSRRSIAGSLLRVLPRSNQVSVGCALIWRVIWGGGSLRLFRLLAEFISSYLYLCGPRDSAGCWPETALRSQGPPAAPGGYSQSLAMVGGLLPHGSLPHREHRRL